MAYQLPKDVLSGIREAQISEGDIHQVLRDYVSARLAAVKGGVIDLQPADGGRPHTPCAWIDLYNSQEGEFKGKRQITVPDVLTLEGKALESSRTDWNESAMVLGTGYLYIDDTKGKVVQHFGSTINGVTPQFSKAFTLPVYQGVPLPDVKSTSDGRYFLSQTYGEGNMNRLTERLVYVSNVQNLPNFEPSNILFWTLPRSHRTGKKYMAVGFDFDGDLFLVDGSSWVVGYYGRSRGVSVNVESAKPTRKK
jgi:hypothetical protein